MDDLRKASVERDIILLLENQTSYICVDSGYVIATPTGYRAVANAIRSGKIKFQWDHGPRHSPAHYDFKHNLIKLPTGFADTGLSFSAKATLERFSTVLNRKGFPRGRFSDSESVLVKEASMDGSAFIVGFACPASCGD